jgi:hypothetical protein
VASERTKAYIKSKLGGWDGTPDVVPFPRRSGPNALQDWAKDWNEFGRRVRRDILVLEKLLRDKGDINQADLYGDPGDPPPDPEI